MASGQAPHPDPQGQVIPPGQQTAPQNLQGSYSINQFTQVNQSIPPHVWTPENFDKYMTLLKDNDDKGRAAFEGHQKRQHQLAWAGILIIAGIVGFGLYLVLIGNPYGKDLVAATVLFLAGYLAGKGEAKLSK